MILLGRMLQLQCNCRSDKNSYALRRPLSAFHFFQIPFLRFLEARVPPSHQCRHLGDSQASFQPWDSLDFFRSSDLFRSLDSWGCLGSLKLVSPSKEPTSKTSGPIKQTWGRIWDKASRVLSFLNTFHSPHKNTTSKHNNSLQLRISNWESKQDLQNIS